MTKRFNTPPGWPQPPRGWTPGPDWRPDPAWPPAPPGWRFLVEDDLAATLFTPVSGQVWAGHVNGGGRGRDSHEAARPGVRSEVRSGGYDTVVARRPQPPTWYARKRVLLPVIVLVALFSFAVGQNTQRPAGPGDEQVLLADATSAPGQPGSAAAGKATPKSAAPTSLPRRKPRATSSAKPPKEPAARPTTEPTTEPEARPSEAAAKKRAWSPETTRPSSPETTRPHRDKPKRTKKPEPTQNDCDPNYVEACVPIASDVDCAEGSGNGPAYLSEAARIVGTDIYDLDRDGDGWGCEPW